MLEDFTWLKIAALIGASMLVQYALLDQIVVFGSHPDLLVVLVVTAAIAGGAEVGAIIGFCVGIAADLLVVTPFGSSAVVFVLLGYGIGAFITSSYGRELQSARIFAATVGVCAVTLVDGLFMDLLGVSGEIGTQLLLTLGVVAVGAMVLSPLSLALWGNVLSNVIGGSRVPSGGRALR